VRKQSREKYDECYTNRLDGLASDTSDVSSNIIFQRLNQVIKFLTYGVGVAITLSVIFGAIQWTVSGANPQAKAAAINRFWQSGIALIAFALGWLILNWLIPGGPLG